MLEWALQNSRKGTIVNKKFRAVSLALLALAASAFVVVNASATTPNKSHFVSEATEDHLIVRGSDSFGTQHQLVLEGDTGGAGISCTDATYTGTLSGSLATTTQSVQVEPHYTNCATTSGTWGEVNVTVDPNNNCAVPAYEFTSGKNGTIHVRCEITIHHPNCTIVVTPQTTNGAVYKTDVRNNKHSFTLEVDAPVTEHFESGLCVFLGTNHTGTMIGTSTVWAENTIGGAVGVTHTE